MLDSMGQSVGRCRKRGQLGEAAELGSDLDGGAGGHGLLLFGQHLGGRRGERQLVRAVLLLGRHRQGRLWRRRRHLRHLRHHGLHDRRRGLVHGEEGAALLLLGLSLEALILAQELEHARVAAVARAESAALCLASVPGITATPKDDYADWLTLIRKLQQV